MNILVKLFFTFVVKTELSPFLIHRMLLEIHDVLVFWLIKRSSVTD